MASKTLELRPCPFCGGKPRVTKDTLLGGITIECPNCAKMWSAANHSERWASDLGFYGWDGSSTGAVVAAWNRRAENDSMCRVEVEDF